MHLRKKNGGWNAFVSSAPQTALLAKWGALAAAIARSASTLRAN
jgi:hypothetical protein